MFAPIHKEMRVNIHFTVYIQMNEKHLIQSDKFHSGSVSDIICPLVQCCQKEVLGSNLHVLPSFVYSLTVQSAVPVHFHFQIMMVSLPSSIFSSKLTVAGQVRAKTAAQLKETKQK